MNNNDENKIGMNVSPCDTENSEEHIPDREETVSLIEAILFAAGYPISFEKLSEVIGVPVKDIRSAADELKENLENVTSGIRLIYVADSCQLCSKEEYEQYVRKALGIRREGKLSNSSLEVLAVVAYNQPVTKAKIEKIRGVDSSYPISTLCDRQLIEPKGRLDAPGKPILYGTTDSFLRCFGLSSLFDLPDYSEAEVPGQISILDMNGEPAENVTEDKKESTSDGGEDR